MSKERFCIAGTHVCDRENEDSMLQAGSYRVACYFRDKLNEVNEQNQENRPHETIVIGKSKYIEWLKGLRDSSDNEQSKDLYNSLISDTEKLW